MININITVITDKANVIMDPSQIIMRRSLLGERIEANIMNVKLEWVKRSKQTNII